MRHKNGKAVGDGLSRRQFLRAAAIAAGATTAFGQAGIASLEDQTPKGTRPVTTRKYPRSILPPNASKVRREIQEFVDEIPIIDTHEHLQSEESKVKTPAGQLDFSLLVSHYAENDLRAAGLPDAARKAIFGPDVSLQEKWRLLEPYWAKMRNTGYGWATELAVRYYYGLDGISAQTYKELTKRMREEYKPGLYGRVVRDAAGIELAVTDISSTDVDRSLFTPVLKIDPFVLIAKPDDLTRFTKATGKEIATPKDITDAMQQLMQEWKRTKVAAGKTPMAYHRTLAIDHVSDSDAAKALDAFRAGGNPRATKQLQDFVFHQVMRACTDQKMPLQIHTGVLAANNYPQLAQTNPLHLCETLAMYPDAKVSIFHAGFPWAREVGTMGKVFTCVYADLCWTHVISPRAAREALDEWLDTMPASKIFAFGGDYNVTECVYGHSIIARTNVGEVLADRVQRGRMNMADAKKVAGMILRENQLTFFNL